ncbi:hypothetical protein HG535_0E01810 [Zygotorulaspora mrakii]|uniref:Spore membrane assembly protein 2 n=1 Tax=Zygotorulaspora mrakii TaxID=42260 RepID=A0A7H9B3N6_ZYGMR|nr:uncharacterized protein HG535_0E01810 [Zygotorulaspora mrakii]QLG73097.1 hypothetical protein HG535_0E01810 [Zygotorulaspora mrakii]
MLIFKRLIVWLILCGFTLLQFSLYVPSFSCALSPGVPTCAEQFSFTVVGGSKMTRELIGSIKELLKLISYLAIDLGWSSDLADSSMYDDENLVNTFNAENIYKVNYFSYCKKTDGKKMYCVRNGGNGMDVITVLVRDVGIQLGNISPLHVNDTEILGDSLVISYHLALTSIRKFIKGDRSRDNAFFNTFLRVNPEDAPQEKTNTSLYSKGVEILHCLRLFNQLLFFLQTSEIIVSFSFFLAVLGFGVVLTFLKRQCILPAILKLMCSLLVSVAAISLFCTIIYLLLLKSLEPSSNSTTAPTGWELLELHVGKGFVISCVRLAIQLFLLPFTIIIANHYTMKEPKKPVLESKSACFNADEA